MMLKALIVEQLEADGTIKTFRMIPTNGEIVVAFASEYDSERTGPFHFLDENDADRFDNGFANSTTRKLGESRFRRDGEMFFVEFGWEGIPAGSGAFSCYALSLPENAQLQTEEFHIDKNLKEQVQCKKYYDSKRNRHVVYVKLMSMGEHPVSFQLKCKYLLAAASCHQLEIPLQTVKPEGKLKDYVEEGGKWIWENIKTIPADYVAEIFRRALL